MEGVVRVSSANMNDRRNRWETGNGRGGEGWMGGEGRAEKTSTCSGRGPHENDRKRTNPPTLSLSRFLVGPCRQLVGRQQLYPPHPSPPTPRWKSWTNREGAFPATNDPQLHPRSSLCNVLSSESSVFRIFTGNNFSRVFRLSPLTAVVYCCNCRK